MKRKGGTRPSLGRSTASPKRSRAVSQRERRLERQVHATAHHEAGHAVMAELLDVPYTSVSIVPTVQDRGRVTLARCAWPTKPNPFDAKLRARVENTVMVLMAGYIAERDFTGRPNGAGARGDQAATWDLVEEVAFSETEQAHQLEALFARCAYLMRQSVIRRSVRALARALLQSGVLGRREAAAVMAGAWKERTSRPRDNTRLRT